MDAPSMFTRKQVPEDVGVSNTGEEGAQGQLHREEKEHKPVLKKVKEKVKKIKHTLTGHSHGHQHDEPAYDDEGGSSYEEEEGDAAMEKGGYGGRGGQARPRLRARPRVYESERLPAVQDLVAKYDPAKAPAAPYSGVRFGGLGGPGFHDPVAQEARHGADDASGARFGGPAVHDPAAHGADTRAVHDPLAREARHGADDASGVHFGNLGGGGAVHEPTPYGVHDRSLQEAPLDDAPPKVRLGDLGGPVVEDPAAPRSKTPAAREGEDIGATPVVREFESMSLSDDPSHVGARAEEWKDAAADKLSGGGNASSDAAPTYTEKIKSVAAVPAEYGRKLASTVYDKVAGGAATAGDEWKDAPAAVDMTTDRSSSSGPGYTDKIKATAAGTTEYGKQLASAAYEKVAAVAPSLRPQVDQGKQQQPPPGRHDDDETSDIISALERAKKPSAAATGGIINNNNNNNSAASSGPGYTEKIKSAAAGTTEYGKQLATTVYEKVAGAGAAVAGKVTQATQSAGTATPGVGAQQHDTTRSVTTGAGNGQDKGVVGVTGYIAEKLRPGEEDRALSSAIADAVQRRKEEVGGTVGQRVPAPGGVIAKAREAVTSLTGGNRVSETVQPDAATGDT
ncbi:hypothetical protein PR202_gb07135 [Eleusine coracana subsp. coracana]|uniref:Uncharacterized protein n=1 Tax=Eleusine coracana subsp. coracana TaxID=191504 RepID=A0AAV5EC69_ELECO|nr:hypothetical protein PR202_gb07135 [Eleusine coracana subsp. coracana]